MTRTCRKNKINSAGAREDKAEGRKVNISGRWIYYENGSFATGVKSIDDIIYTFDQHSEIAVIPKSFSNITMKNEQGEIQ